MLCRNVERKRLKEEHRARVSHEEKSGEVNSTKHKRQILPGDTTNVGDLKFALQQQDENIKRKRSANDYGIADNSTDTANYEPNDRDRTRKTVVSKIHSQASNDNSGMNLTSWVLPKSWYFWYFCLMRRKWASIFLTLIHMTLCDPDQPFLGTYILRRSITPTRVWTRLLRRTMTN